jgi:hypothetical protein
MAKIAAPSALAAGGGGQEVSLFRAGPSDTRKGIAVTRGVQGAFPTVRMELWRLTGGRLKGRDGETGAWGPGPG